MEANVPITWFILEGRKKRPILPRRKRLFIKIETEIPGFANINNNDDKFIFLMTQENKVVTNIWHLALINGSK